MLFWLIAALLTLCACMAVLVPMMRRDEVVVADSRHDLEVYRDQLREVERDTGRGVIGKDEAEEARAEIGRRILRLGEGERTASGPGRGARFAATAAVLAVPLIAWGLYAGYGSPGLGGEPLAGRLAKAPAESTVDELVARAEAHLAANPDDQRGWDVLAPIYLRLGRNADAVTAYGNAIRVGGSSAERESGLGEAIAAVAGGMVSADAEAAFRRALAIDGQEPRARFFLASALAQEGRMREAADAWKSMLAALPDDSFWRTPTEQAIAEAERHLSVAAMPEAERAASIETMVETLDGKLRQNPQDAEGWQRLVRSYQVLGRGDQARDALARGLAALGSDSEGGRGLSALARSLDIEEAATP